MRNVTTRLLQVAALAGLTTTFGWAGAPNDVKANIPFAFNIGNTSLPAGEYTLASHHGSRVIYVEDARGAVRVVFQLMVGAAPVSGSDSKLVFRAYGTRYYLGGVWNATMRSGGGLLKTAAEREMEIASAAPETRVVLIAQK